VFESRQVAMHGGREQHCDTRDLGQRANGSAVVDRPRKEQMRKTGHEGGDHAVEL
jgi:hypothetical protein